MEAGKAKRTMHGSFGSTAIFFVAPGANTSMIIIVLLIIPDLQASFWLLKNIP